MPDLLNGTAIVNPNDILTFDYITNVLKLIVIFVVAFYIFYIILKQISNIVSFFGVYHKLDISKIKTTEGNYIWGELVKHSIQGFFCSILFFTEYESEKFKESEGEPFWIKISKVTRLYIFLSLLLVGSFYIILTNQIVPLGSNISLHATSMSITLAMSLLLIVRILANPSDSPKIIVYFPNYKVDLVEQHRERILGFLYSFICTNLFVTMLIGGYSFYAGIQFPLSLGFDTHAAVLILYYLALLFTVVMIGELYLLFREPIHPIKSKYEKEIEDVSYYDGDGEAPIAIK